MRGGTLGDVRPSGAKRRGRTRPDRIQDSIDLGCLGGLPSLFVLFSNWPVRKWMMLCSPCRKQMGLCCRAGQQWSTAAQVDQRGKSVGQSRCRALLPRPGPASRRHNSSKKSSNQLPVSFLIPPTNCLAARFSRCTTQPRATS